jgi:probable biosynthetic protein (TIGR04098 family)
MSTARNYTQRVNMPQMALTGLSESWLYKEIGDCHWHMLCEDLGLKSNEIFDEFGNRLYATFIRIRFESRNCLKDFNENDLLDIEGTVRRLGNSLYFGQVGVTGSDKHIRSSLATTFSTRESNSCNHKLTKGVPSGSDENVITKLSDMPAHIVEYTKLKKGSIHKVMVGDHSFALTDEVIFKTLYRINPYTDINGVGLLYFAAYPLINDYCEMEYFNARRISGEHWALNSSTMARDVFYFANCNIDDVISYRLHSYDIIADNQIALYSSLWREKDGTEIARVFTIKQFETLESNMQ